MFPMQHAYFLYCQSSRFKDVLANPSHNAIVMEFSRFLLIPMFSSENSTLVKILDTISLIFRFLSISFLIRSLELVAFPQLGYQLLCWVTYSLYLFDMYIYIYIYIYIYKFVYILIIL